MTNQELTRRIERLERTHRLLTRPMEVPRWKCPMEVPLESQRTLS